MLKKLLIGIVAGIFFLCLSGISHAILTTIGTANYSGSNYNLIWDDDNNGNSLVWLDYTNVYLNWADQNVWASGLGAVLTINLKSEYTVTWDDPSWRLPSTVDGPWVGGFNGTTTAGYNITTSEMGHLFYEELVNLGQIATDGTNPQAGWGLYKTGDFNNLLQAFYWSETEYAADSNNAWFFGLYNGNQDEKSKTITERGLAVRNGRVTTSASIVPEPTTILLLGLGVMGLAGARKRMQK